MKKNNITQEEIQQPHEQSFQVKDIIVPQSPLSIRMSIAELLDADLPDPNYVVPGLIPVGLTYITGRPKVGKSIFTLQLAGAKGSGKNFLGKALTKGKVFYIDLENGMSRMQKRCKAVGISIDASFHVQFGWHPLDKDGMWNLIKEIEEQKWDVVIIDTFSRAMSTKADQMDVQEMSNIVGTLQRIAIRNNMSIILIDHQRKPGKNEGNPIDDVLGSTGKSAPADAVIALYHKPGGKQIEMKIVQRDEEDISMHLTWSDTEKGWVSSEEAKVRLETRKDRVLAAVTMLDANGILPTTTRIAHQVELDKSNVNSIIKELVAEGKLRPGDKRGREVPYYPSSPSLNNNDNNNHNTT